MKKKIFSCFLVLAITFLAIFSSDNSSVAFALSQKGQTADEYFLQTVQEFGYEGEIEFVKNLLYDETLTNNGFEYIFEVDGTTGVALMIKCFDEEGEDYFDIMELYFDAKSPFKDTLGLRVYIKMIDYIEYVDGNFYLISDGTIISAEDMELIALSGFKYYGISAVSHNLETIEYDYKSDVSRNNSIGLPTYNYLRTSNSGCANLAGAIIVSYWKTLGKPNLLDYSPTYINQNGVRTYYSQDDNADNLIEQLRVLMKTDSKGGTTVNNFKSGLTQFVTSKNYLMFYTSMMSGNKFDYDKFKIYVHADVPVAIFLSKFNYAPTYYFLTTAPGSDFVATSYYKSTHVVVGSGYREVSYNQTRVVSVYSPVWYNPFRHVDEIQDVNFRNDQYIYASMCFSDDNKGYLRMNDNITFDDAFTAEVY